MKVSIIPLSECCDLIEKSEIQMQVSTPTSTTSYLIVKGRSSVIINTAIENYFITQGDKDED